MLHARHGLLPPTAGKPPPALAARRGPERLTFIEITRGPRAETLRDEPGPIDARSLRGEVGDHGMPPPLLPLLDVGQMHLDDGHFEDINITASTRPRRPAPAGGREEARPWESMVSLPAGKIRTCTTGMGLRPELRMRTMCAL